METDNNGREKVRDRDRERLKPSRGVVNKERPSEKSTWAFSLP